jgi:hypothetical protein
MLGGGSRESEGTEGKEGSGKLHDESLESGWLKRMTDFNADGHNALI